MTGRFISEVFSHKQFICFIHERHHLLPEFATGAFTKAEIRRLMDTWGVETRRGTLISNQSLDNFFRNKYYAGILIDPWSSEEYQGQHIPMVSREEFGRVQQVISRRNRSVPHQKERPEFPLRGFVRCSHCRAYMTGSFSRGRSCRYPYYHCKCRHRQSYPVKLFHAEFASFLEDIAPKPELVEKLGEAIIQVTEKRQTSWKTKKTAAKRNLLA